jgi:hypothetical protein
MVVVIDHHGKSATPPGATLLMARSLIPYRLFNRCDLNTDSPTTIEAL